MSKNNSKNNSSSMLFNNKNQNIGGDNEKYNDQLPMPQPY